MSTNYFDDDSGKNMRSNRNLPPAVIAGAYQTGVLAARSLKRHGVQTHLFDCNPDNPGFKSKYGPAHLCPNPDTDSTAWLSFMVALSERIGKKSALIPSSDLFVSAIAKHASALETKYILSPGIIMQGLLAEKHTQYNLAENNGMPMPRTRLVGNVDEAIAFSQESSFPCLLKPTHFREWLKLQKQHPLFGKKIIILKTMEMLKEIYQLASTVNSHVILQEIIEGADTSKRVYISCYNYSGKRIAHAMFRELRCHPFKFGPASVSEPIEDPKVDEVCDRFLKSIKYVGICEIEMKWDSRDGQIKLIEANPRLSGGGDAAPYAGVDLPWIHYQDLIGEPVDAVSPNRRTFKHIVLRAEGNAIPAYWSAGLIGLKDIYNSYRSSPAFFDLDRNDLRYSFETIFVAIRSLIFGFVRNILVRR